MQMGDRGGVKPKHFLGGYGYFLGQHLGEKREAI